MMVKMPGEWTGDARSRQEVTRVLHLLHELQTSGQEMPGADRR